MEKQKSKPVILNDGRTQSLLVWPTDGLLVRFRKDGKRLVPSIENGEANSVALRMIIHALSHFNLDPVLDPDHPFRPYHPGVIGA
jgi:hypothetical protein